GNYRITLLLPGFYVVTIRGTDGHVITRVGVTVTPGTTAVGSFVVDRRFLTDLPVHGSAFDAVLTAARRAVGDDFGVAVSGGTSLENRYVIDGVDVTELGIGKLGTSLPYELVDQVREISQGAGPELGRATGGFVEVTTKHGSNELHGSVFGSLTPSWLAAA